MHYTATINWSKLPTENFTDSKYSRVHQWKFDGGMQFNASSSPHIVPVPLSDPAFIDPEEAFVASIASCHMLFFLSFCAKRKYIVACYEDSAEGILDKADDGRMQMTSVTLHPVVTFEGDQPSDDTITLLHDLAHNNCFIANSIKTEIRISHKDIKPTSHSSQ
jgi:organic hydroperoxide reductase OsmC/OhrA